MSVGPFNLSQLPTTVNLNGYQGDDFTIRVPVKDRLGQPLDLTGASVRSQIRLTPQSPDMLGVLVASITASTITLHLPSTLSTILPARSVYDAELTLASGRVITFAAGFIQLTPEVTRD